MDTAVPCDKGAPSAGLMWWVLAQKVLNMDGTIRGPLGKVMPDLCFHRDPEATEKKEPAAAAKAVTQLEISR